MAHMFSFLRRLRKLRKPNFHPSGFMTSNILRGRWIHNRDKSVREIHHAAMVGSVWRVKKTLFFRSTRLNDRDVMSRTALHLACAHGHPRVVRLLVKRKCMLDLSDVNNQTALIQAVQSQQEECAAILLDHGADPDVADIGGNTALHYAVRGENMAIVAKLLSCRANMKEKNKDGLTPLSLAQRENKEQMVLFLLNSGAVLPTVNEMESDQPQIFENAEGRKHKASSEKRNIGTDLQESPKKSARKTNFRKVAESSEEDSLKSNLGLDDSWDLSDDDCKVSDPYEKQEYLLHKNHMSKDENAKLRLGKSTVKNQNQEMGKKYFENIKIVKEKNDHLHKTRKHNEEILTETVFQCNGQPNVPAAEIRMLHLKLESEKQNRERLETEVESYKSRLATAVQDHEQCQASHRDLQLAFQTERDERFCLWEEMNCNMSNLKDNNEHLCQELSEAESKVSNLEIELSHTRDDLRAMTSVLKWAQRVGTQTQFHIKEVNHLYKRKQKNLHTNVVKQRSLEEKLSHLQSVNKLLQQQLDATHNQTEDEAKTAINTQDQLQDVIKALQTENENQCHLLDERNKELINECIRLKEMIHEYENDKVERDAFVSQLQQKLADTLRKQSVLEGSLEATSCYHMNFEDETQDSKKKLDENSSQVSDSYERECLLCENHMLQDENAKLRLEIDTVKNQNREKETKYFEDIKIIVEKNDHLTKIIQLTEEKLQNTMLQYNGQLDVLTAENAVLKIDLENEKQNRERLETEVESHKSRLATAVQDHEQCQASHRDLQLTFQTERDEWFSLRDKMNCDMSNLKDNNEHLCQELSEAESKVSSLEIELNHTKDDLRAMTSVLKWAQSVRTQINYHIKEVKHLYKKKQEELHSNDEKQRSLEEKLSHLQSENMLLRQQLDAAYNQAEDEAKTAINTQDQLQDVIKALQTENENQCCMLHERNKELINECIRLKEIIHEYENDKVERDAVVAQLQQELADTLRKQSMLESSLDVMSRRRMHLEDETRDLKRKLDKNRSRIDDLTAKLEKAFSRSLCLNEENKFRQQESLLLKEKCEKLENENQKCKQELLFVQTKLLSKARLEPLRENHNPSTALLKLRVKELEFELSSIKISQDSKSKKYKELYLIETKRRKSLTTKLNKKKKQLRDIRMELLLKEEENILKQET